MRERSKAVQVTAALAGALVGLSAFLVVGGSSPAGAAMNGPTSARWCAEYGASVVGWTETTPNLPICGPGPGDGGTYADVTIPGPYGASGYFFNATPGFQCVELAERFLALADGLAPVLANGQQVARNYHAAYSNTSLYVNGSRSSIGHAPLAGDVISFSNAPGFDAWQAGHVAVVDRSSVNSGGNGTVTIAQENVGAGYWIYRLDVVRWRLVDPTSAPDALWGFAYAEWLHVRPYRAAEASSAVRLFAKRPRPGIGAIEGLVAEFRPSGATSAPTYATGGLSPSRIASSNVAWKMLSSFKALFPPRSSADSRARIAASLASVHAGS